MKRAFLLVAALLLMGAGDPATESVHTVEEGETLGGIANRAGVDKALIAAANGLVEPYTLRIGQELQIPRQRAHTVKQGEALSRIAESYAVPLSAIAIANKLEKPYNIRAGQELIIPAVFTAAPPAQPQRSEPYFRWPHDGEILMGYARRPDGGGHDGLDIAVNIGDMIRAAASGTVEFAGVEASRFGRVVVIDHGHGWKTLYAHMSRITVAKDEYVKAGERIGLGGQSGKAERPELHFAIQKSGVEIDPVTKLPARQAPAPSDES